MTWIIWPEQSLVVELVYVLLFLLALAFWFLERSGLLKLNYSKFRKSQGMDSRWGMFILYFVPIPVQLLAARTYLADPSIVQLLLMAAVCLHFAKRCWEVLFLHKYSGPIDRLTVLQITLSYSFASFVLGSLHRTTIASIDGLFLIGLVLFGIGEYGNYYHHRLLASLREQASDYFIPKGGLFRYVCAPHYLMELGSWLGIALMSRHIGAYLIFFWTCSYLLARSMRTLDWYRRHFADFPSERKALVPFLV